MGKLLFQVRYNVQRWTPGEGLPTDSGLLDREGRPLPQPAGPDYHYLDDYAGKIDSIVAVEDVESGKETSLRRMEAKDHPVIEIDITEEQRHGVANKTLKIQGGKLVPVTFADRFGAVAALLREQHADPEAWERDEIARVEAEEAENTQRQTAYDLEVEMYRVAVADFPVDLHAWSLDPEGIPPASPERPKALRLIEVAPSSFDVAVRQLARTLPGMLTETGTGLYSVKKTPTLHNDTQSGAPAAQVITLTTGGLTLGAFTGGYILNTTRSELRSIVSHNAGDATLEGSLTNWQAGDTLEVYDAWSTIQAAYDQLFTDQGATLFTAPQYVRIHAGTYVENPLLDPSLNDNIAEEYWVIVEGDSSVARSAIVIAPGSGNGLEGQGAVVYRHLTVNDIVRGDQIIEVDDCAFTDGLQGRLKGYFHDSEFTKTGSNAFYNTSWGAEIIVENCTLKGATGISMYWPKHTVISGCTFDIEAGGTGYVNHQDHSDATTYSHILRNCTFYGGDYGIKPWYRSRVELTNCIFSGVARPIYLAKTFEESTTGGFGSTIALRNNCFDNYTAFASVAGGDVSYATFSSYAKVDASGDIFTDPLLTDPGAGDFSLAAGSPCIRSAPWAGVVNDVNGNPYATDRTDRGAVRSGTSSIAPVSTGVSVSAGAITATFTVGGAPNVRARLANRSGISQEELQRLGSGDISFSAVVPGDYTIVAWGCDVDGNPIGTPSLIAIVTVSATSSVVGYGTLQRTPHTIRIVRPTRNRDSDTGVSSLDYASPVSDRQVTGFLSTSGGTVTRGAEGEVIGFDAVWFSNESDFEVADQAVVAIPGLSGNFLVIGTEPKYDLDGDFDHNEVLLSKDNKR